MLNIVGMEKRTAILKSVLRLVNREGFYHLNMKKIASEANVATGTIYLYFKGKEELINALFSMVVTEFNQAVLNAYRPDHPLEDNFRDMLSTAIDYYLRAPDAFSFVEQYTYAPFLFKEVRDQNFSLLLPIYKMMRAGKKQGHIRNIPDAVLLSMIHGPMNTMIKLHLAKKTNLGKKSVRQYFFSTVWQSVART